MSAYVTVRAADFIAPPTATPPTRPRPPSYTMPDPSAEPPAKAPALPDFVLPDEDHALRITAIASARRLPGLDSDPDMSDDEPRALTLPRTLRHAQPAVPEPAGGSETVSPRSSSRRSSSRRSSSRRSSRKADTHLETGKPSGRRSRSRSRPRRSSRSTADEAPAARSTRRSSRRSSRTGEERALPRSQSFRAKEFVVEELEAPAARLRTSWRAEDGVVPLTGHRLEERPVENIILWPRPERPELLWRPAHRMDYPPPPTFPTLSKVPALAELAAAKAAPRPAEPPSESDVSDATDGSDAGAPPPAHAPPPERPGSPLPPASLGSSAQSVSARSVSSVTTDPSGSASALQSVGSGARRLSAKLLGRGRRASEAGAPPPRRRSSAASRDGERALRAAHRRRRSLDALGDALAGGAGAGTQYYQDEYVQFIAQKKPASPRRAAAKASPRRARGLYFARIRFGERAAPPAQEEPARPAPLPAAAADDDALSVTTSDDEYVPQCA